MGYQCCRAVPSVTGMLASSSPTLRGRRQAAKEGATSLRVGGPSGPRWLSSSRCGMTPLGLG